MRPDSFMEQLALQTADSVSRGFLARRRCVLRPLSLSCSEEPEGVTMPPPGLEPPGLEPPPAGASIVQLRVAGVRVGVARARRARGPRSYVRPTARPV